MPWAANDPDPVGYWAVTVRVDASEVEAASGFLYAHGAAGVEYEDGNPAQSPFADIPLPAGLPFVRAFFPDDEEWDRTRESLNRQAEDWGWAVEYRPVATEDWADGWKQYYQPFAIGDGYWVVPAWSPAAPVDAAHTLWLDPGMAFGTGTHATTRMCLETILTLPGCAGRVLDLGAGSGILAILAAKRGARRVAAVEPDPVAVRALSANVALNGMAGTIDVIRGTLADVPPHWRFDCLLANLIADIIVAEWPRMAGCLAAGGRAVLSGVLESRADDIARAVRRTGHRVLATSAQEGWLLLVVGE